MKRLLRAARALGLGLCPSLTREPGVVSGCLYYRPTSRRATERQIARSLASYLAAKGGAR